MLPYYRKLFIIIYISKHSIKDILSRRKIGGIKLKVKKCVFIKALNEKTGRLSKCFKDYFFLEKLIYCTNSFWEVF